MAGRTKSIRVSKVKEQLLRGNTYQGYIAIDGLFEIDLEILIFLNKVDRRGKPKLAREK